MNDDDQTVVRDREVVSNRTAGDGPVYPPQPGVADYVGRIVKVLFAILQALLILRIVFLLLVANQNNSIVQSVLNLTDPFVNPFVNMFKTNDIRTSGGSVLDVPAVVALVAWSILEWIVLMIIGIFGRTDTPIKTS